MTSLWKLNSILPYFELDERGFAEVLDVTSAFVAGGSCLAAFLGVPIKEGQDMDIWLPTAAGFTKERPADWRVIWPFRIYLESRGYKKETADDIFQARRSGKENEYTSMEPFKTTINRIHNFYKTNKDGKQMKIQVIECGNVSVTDILNHFDLNICKFYTEGVSWKNGSPIIPITHPDLETNPKRLLEIHGHIMRPVANSGYCEGSARTIKRIAKYERRGFTLQTDDKKEYF
jgi:hypothetical protein